MSEERRFDWGPPVQSGDGLKEWLVYLVIVAILGIGSWFLLDNNARKRASKVSNKDSKIVAVEQNLDQKLETFVPEEKEQNVQKQESLTEVKNVPALTTTKIEFFVQIGAFSDEPSANEIYNLLKKENIPATLLKPDKQYEIYRLVTGPYSTESEAEKKAEQLNEIGFPCFVVEAQ